MTNLLQTVNFDRPVIDYSKTSVEFVNHNESIHKVVDKIIKTGYRRFPVLEIRRFPIRKNRVLGIVTAMDILDAFLRGVDFNSPVSLIMSRDVVTCNLHEPLEIVVKRFKFARRGGFPIVDDKTELKGLITEHDIVNLIKNHIFDVKIKDIMTRKPFYINPTSFYSCLNSMVNTKYRKLPIVENKKLYGLVTDRLCLDIMRKTKFQKNEMYFSVKEVMIKKIFTIDPESDIKQAIELMRNNRIGGLIVVEDNALKGIITERDILDKILC